MSSLAASRADNFYFPPEWYALSYLNNFIAELKCVLFALYYIGDPNSEESANLRVVQEQINGKNMESLGSKCLLMHGASNVIVILVKELDLTPRRKNAGNTFQPPYTVSKQNAPHAIKSF
jgi:hypothetical protein